MRGLVDLGGRIKDDEKGEEQGHKIGIGDHPSFLVAMWLRPLFHCGVMRAAFGIRLRLAHRSRVFRLACWRKPLSLASNMRGLMPSRMEMTPSRVSSRRIWRIAQAMAQFAGDGQGDEVGEADTVDGGDEGDGDASADFVDLIEMLHDLNEAEDGADDSDGWGKASGGFIDAGQLFFGFGAGVEFKLHDGA